MTSIGARTAHRLALAALIAAPLTACRGTASGPKPNLGDEGGTAGPAVKLEELQGSISSVAVVGLPRERTATATSLLHSQVGGNFDRNQVAADVRALWGMGSVAEVNAEGRKAAGGIALRFRVKEQPRVRSLDVRGSTAIPGAQWVAQMPIKSGDFADPARLNSIRIGMMAQLRQAGFATAKVAWAAVDTKGSGVDVVFDVTEGKMISLGSVEFRGNKAVSRKALSELMVKAGAQVGGRYWRDAIERGLEAINNHYYDLGYVNVGVGPIDEKLSTEGTSIALSVTVAEGAQFRLGDLNFAGTLAATPREYASKFGLRKGQVFSRRKIAEGLERIRELHRAKGKPNPDLIPVTEVDAAKKRIKVTVQVVEPGGTLIPRQPQPGQARPGQAQPAPGPQPAPQARPAQPQPAPPPAATPPAQPAPGSP
jgi:outer membrane protein insertion porin family